MNACFTVALPGNPKAASRRSRRRPPSPETRTPAARTCPRAVLCPARPPRTPLLGARGHLFPAPANGLCAPSPRTVLGHLVSAWAAGPALEQGAPGSGTLRQAHGTLSGPSRPAQGHPRPPRLRQPWTGSCLGARSCRSARDAGRRTGNEEPAPSLARVAATWSSGPCCRRSPRWTCTTPR